MKKQFVIGMLGLCSVINPGALHNNGVFSGKVGIVKIKEPISLISVRNEKDQALASIIDKHLNSLKN